MINLKFCAIDRSKEVEKEEKQSGREKGRKVI